MLKLHSVFVFIFFSGLICQNVSGSDSITLVSIQQIRLLTDSIRTLGISQVEKRQDEAIPVSPQFIVPSIDYDYWFIIKCKNNSHNDIDQYIGWDIACFEIADLYFRDTLDWIHKKNGLSVPIDEREVYSRLPGFEVRFKALEEKTLYLHLHSKYLVPASIVNKNLSSYRKSNIKVLFSYWFYMGAAVSILLYNLLLFFQLRERVYLYYILYVFFLFIWISLDSGIFLFVSPNMKLYYFLSIGAPTMAFFLTLFTREILNVKSFSKWMDKVLIFICFSYLLIAILVGINVSYYQFLGLIAMPFTLFLLFVGIYGVIKRIPLSKFYVIASGFYILGLFFYAGLTLGAVPYTPLTRYGFMLGSFFELIVFSLALGYRIKLLQAEKLSYKNKIIENERMMSKKLEVMVMERTEELQVATEKLAGTNRQLQESNNAKDKLFSIISHDLKGPLGSVKGLLESYNTNYNKLDKERRQHFIHVILESTNQIFRMLENLLFWSRNQIDGMVFIPERADIVQIISQTAMVLKSQADEKQIKIHLPDSGMEVQVDIEMIKTVVRNLLSNAIKFSRPGGEISVSVAKTRKKEVVVEIRDSGIGISPEKMDSIFTLGGVNSLPGTNNEKGTGLGLVLCKDFIEKHNGEIWVDSEPEKGSTFYFSIPV